MLFRSIVRYLIQWFETVEKIEYPPDFLANQYIDRNTQKLIALLNNSDEKKHNENISEFIYDKEKFKSIMKEENEEEVHWKRNIMMETTYREDGKMIFVIMYYDLFKQGFAYYSDESFISHKILNAMAMKYVKLYFCKDFFLDEAFNEQHEIKYKSPLFEVFSDKETKKKKADNSHVFAKFKNDHDPRKQENDPKKESLRNKFIHMGKTYNFSILNKPKEVPKPQVKTSFYGLFDLGYSKLSYKDYKTQSQGTREA